MARKQQPKTPAADAEAARREAHREAEQAHAAEAHAQAEAIVGTCPLGQPLAGCPLSLAADAGGTRAVCSACGGGWCADRSQGTGG
jgi:hypothetical protein